jgi:hypothetical protein
MGGCVWLAAQANGYSISAAVEGDGEQQTGGRIAVVASESGGRQMEWDARVQRLEVERVEGRSARSVVTRRRDGWPNQRQSGATDAFML